MEAQIKKTATHKNMIWVFHDTGGGHFEYVQNGHHRGVSECFHQFFTSTLSNEPVCQEPQFYPEVHFFVTKGSNYKVLSL